VEVGDVAVENFVESSVAAVAASVALHVVNLLRRVLQASSEGLWVHEMMNGSGIFPEARRVSLACSRCAQHLHEKLQSSTSQPYLFIA
jgi:hypothetical protein